MGGVGGVKGKGGGALEESQTAAVSGAEASVAERGPGMLHRKHPDVQT